MLGLSTPAHLHADHWQNKPYPYATGGLGGATLGDGIMGSLGLSTHYYWCWIAIGVCIAYILLLNIIIVILLTILPRKPLYSLCMSYMAIISQSQHTASLPSKSCKHMHWSAWMLQPSHVAMRARTANMQHEA